MNKQAMFGIIIGVVVLAGAAFYAGTMYAGTNIASTQSAQRQGGQGRGNRFTGNGGFVAGKIVAKDASSITIELGGQNATSTPAQTSGSKIILYGNSTQVGKTVAGVLEDLQVGQNITVNGTQNAGGSVTAQNIQIRPVGGGPRGQ